jgi:hypothetical protein
MTMTHSEVRAAIDGGRYDVRGVLAGAYHGRSVSERALLTHVAVLDASGYPVRTLCNRVPADNLADVMGGAPSCAECAGRLGRMLAR